MAVSVKNLKKRYGRETVVDIEDFSVADGEILGIAGNNGAGKTTLFRLLLDLIKADEGEVSICGINPAETETWKNRTGAFLDDSFLIDFLSPEEYFNFVGAVSGLSEQDTAERTAAFSSFLESVTAGGTKLIRELSAGNKQKTGIAAALLTRPELVILDEPFNFLDPSGQIELKRLLKSYHEQTGATIMISSHNLMHTVDVSTRLALMEKGKIIRDFPADDAASVQAMQEYFNRNA